MQALCSAHIFNHRLTPIEFFRTSYFWKYDKDMPPVSLHSDVEAFQYRGTVPAYAVDYLIRIYGVQ